MMSLGASVFALRGGGLSLLPVSTLLRVTRRIAFTQRGQMVTPMLAGLESPGNSPGDTCQPARFAIDAAQLRGLGLLLALQDSAPSQWAA